MVPYLLCLSLALIIAALLRQQQSLRRPTTELHDIRRRLREFQSLAQIGDWELDLIRNQLFWSDETFRIFEIDSTRFKASYDDFLKLVHPDDRSAVNQAYLSSVKERSAYDVVHRLQMPDGRLKTLRERGTTFYDSRSGRPLRSIGTVQDISNETALRLEAEQHRTLSATLIDSIPAIVLMLDSDGRIRHVNRFFEDLTGYAFEDIQGQDWFATMIPERERERILAIFASNLDGTLVQGQVNAIVTRSGREVDIEWYGKPLTQGNIASTSVIAIGLDVSYRSELEAKTRETQDRLREVMDSLPAWLGVCTPDGRVIDANRSALDSIGVTMQAMHGVPLWETPWVETSDNAMRLVHDAMSAAASGASIQTEFRVWRSPGRIGIFDGTIRPILNAQGLVQYIIAFGVDITERKEAEASVLALNKELSQRIAALSESEQRFQRAFLGNPIAMGIQRLRDDVVLDINDAFETLFEWRRDEIIGKKLSEFDIYVNPAQRPQALSLLERKKHINAQEMEFRTSTGEIRTVLLTIEVIGWDGEPCALASYVDLSDRIREEREKNALAKQLHESKRLEALGTFANGMAHDFRNILAVIVGNASALSQHIDKTGTPSQHLRLIEMSSQRGIEMVNRISTFSRGQQQPRMRIDLESAMRDSCALMASTLPETIQLEVRSSTDVPPVLSDEGQIHQILSNLVSNAVRALGKQAGRIEVAVEGVTLEKPTQGRLGEISPGLYALLSVTDSGPGVDPSLRNKIFDPFVSTQPVGAGSGLGLAVVDGIVRAHAGHLLLDPATTEGASFRVWLPAAADEVPSGTTFPLLRSGVPRSAARILVIEDDAAFAATLELALRTRGWSPTIQLSAKEALERLRYSPDGWDAVITDFKMPEVTGIDVIRTVALMGSTMPVILYSGESDAALEQCAITEGAFAVVGKDSTIESLIEVLERAFVSWKSDQQLGDTE